MFERYTQPARRVIFRARYIAGRLGSNCIDTEHLLLSVLSTDQTLARRFFGAPWVAEEILKRVKQSKPRREPVQGPVELPLSAASKAALLSAVEEADSWSNGKLATEHLLLGLLTDQNGLAAEILAERGVRLSDVRQQLQSNPHDDSATEKILQKDIAYPPEIVRLRATIQEIKTHIEQALAEHDFEKAKAYSEKEGAESRKLFSLYQQHGLADWLYD